MNLTNKTTMKANLGIFDRITIPSLLPEKGTFTEAIVCEDLRQKIKITQDEIAKYDIKNTEDGKGITWTNESPEGEEFELTDLEVNVILKGFDKLSEAGEVPTTEQFVKLYRKIKN